MTTEDPSIVRWKKEFKLTLYDSTALTPLDKATEVYLFNLWNHYRIAAIIQNNNEIHIRNQMKFQTFPEYNLWNHYRILVVDKNIVNPFVEKTDIGVDFYWKDLIKRSQTQNIKNQLEWIIIKNIWS